MARFLSLRSKGRLKNYVLLICIVIIIYFVQKSLKLKGDEHGDAAAHDALENLIPRDAVDNNFIDAKEVGSTTVDMGDGQQHDDSKQMEEDHQEKLMEQHFEGEVQNIELEANEGIRIQQEEMKQADEEDRRQEEEQRRNDEEQRRQLEEEQRKREEEQRRLEEEQRRLDEEQRRVEEERRRVEEEQRRQEEERRRQEEEENKRRQAEEEAERRRQEEDRRQQEENKQPGENMGHDDYVKHDDSNTGEEDVPIYTYDYIHSFERFQVGEAKIKFLKNFKSPCWLEDNLDPFPYEKSRLFTGPKYMKKSCFSDGLKKSTPTHIQLPGQDRKYRVRCLPYFMLLGMAKSGTSDFQSRILNSDYVFKGFSKELYWWDQYRFNPNATLSDYSDLLDFAIKDMIHIEEKDSEGGPFWPGLVGEMTTITLPDVAYWREDPRNAGLQEPKYITPHDIYPIIPKVKLIVLMRNPVTRLYSHYNMWAPLRGYNKSPEDFHMRVVNSMKWWDQCRSILPLRGCLYGSPPEMPEVEHTLSSWWPTNANHSGEFRNGLYYLFLKDWLSVFPRENFLFLRSEDYNVDKLKTMNDEVYPFLGLPSLEGKQADRVENMPNAFQVTYDPMLPETREILHNLYQPYNDQLAELLGESRWAWRDT